MKKQSVKKLVLAKETVHNLSSLQGVEGGVSCSNCTSYSDQMRYCDSWWHCGASADTFC
ncbi:MAG TPA: hypothetical protein VF789_08110 [Thermoanaerobaculia bacterium]